jgi:hypothetical protein
VLFNYQLESKSVNELHEALGGNTIVSQVHYVGTAQVLPWTGSAQPRPLSLREPVIYAENFPVNIIGGKATDLRVVRPPMMPRQCTVALADPGGEIRAFLGPMFYYPRYLVLRHPGAQCGSRHDLSALDISAIDLGPLDRLQWKVVVGLSKAGGGWGWRSLQHV